MKRLVPGGLLIVPLAPNVMAQTEAFTRQVPCPTNPSIMGYTNIPDLNNDMADELTRIEGLGVAPDIDYTLNLCSDPDNVFDATGNNPIRPVIDRARIYCGGPDAVQPFCFIDASRQQVIVEDIATSLQDYRLNDVLFQGLTFRRFSRGLSVSLIASANATAAFIDCSWEDFDNTDYVINIENPAGNSMRLVLVNAVIRSISGDPNEASAGQAFINNIGGNVEVDGIQMLDTFPEFTAFNNAENGQMTISRATVKRSVLPNNFARMNSGTLMFSSVTISNSYILDNVFFARGRSTEVIIDDLNMLDNDQVPRVWNGVNIAQGASLSISGSTFRGNINMLFGVTIQALPRAPSIAVIQDSTFIGNVGSQFAFGLPSSLVNVLGNNRDMPFVEVLRVDFVQNSNFISNISALQGGEFRVLQSCFIGNTGSHVVNAGPGSEGSTGKLNFVDGSELSTICEQNPNRFSIDTQGCSLLSDAEVCLSQIVLTEGPSNAPSEPPTNPPTKSPSSSPTLIPTTFPSTTAPTETLMPSSSSRPTISQSPTMTTSAPITAPLTPTISRPTFRRDCYHGKSSNEGCGKRRRKPSKSRKKLNFSTKSSKRSKKLNKNDKSGKKSGKSSKGEKGGRNRHYWGPLGGARGAYRDHTFQTGSFAKMWSDDNLRGWDLVGIVDLQSVGGNRILLPNATIV